MTVLFPEVVMPITIGRPSSIAAAQQAVREQRQIVVVLQRDPQTADPKAGELHDIGVVANVLRYITASDTEHHLICQGVQRFRITEQVEGWPYPGRPRPARARADRDRPGGRGAVPEPCATRRWRSSELIPQAPAELRATIAAITRPGALADMAAAYLDVGAAGKAGHPRDRSTWSRGWTRSSR